MSQPGTEAALLRELAEEMGRVEPHAVPVALDPALEAHLFARVLRQQLAKAAAEEGVTLSEVARRLRISRAAVSRVLADEGPMLTSTAAMIAAALDRYLYVEVRKPRRATPAGNAMPPAGGVAGQFGSAQEPGTIINWAGSPVGTMTVASGTVTVPVRRPQRIPQEMAS